MAFLSVMPSVFRISQRNSDGQRAGKDIVISNRVASQGHPRTELHCAKKYKNGVADIMCPDKDARNS